MNILRLKAGTKDEWKDTSLKSWSRVAIIWWWFAWSCAALHIKKQAEKIWKQIFVDVFESKHFENKWPMWCNRCWWVLSASLIAQMMEDGYKIPKEILRRPIKSYVFHSWWCSTKVNISDQKHSSYSVYRWWWPLWSIWWEEKSFDSYIQQLALESWAFVINEKVMDIVRGVNWKIKVITRYRWFDEPLDYDFLVWAMWVNTPLLNLPFFKDECKYIPPEMEKWYIKEIKLEESWLKKLWDAMHIFMSPILEIKLAALIPKEGYATLVLIWNEIQNEHIDQFFELPMVRNVLPDNFKKNEILCCWCRPNLVIWTASFDHNANVAFVWDAMISRLYKDWIWTAYRTSKALAQTIVWKWTNELSLFLWEYGKVCREQTGDNAIWKIIFSWLDFVRTIKKARQVIEKINTDDGKLSKNDYGLLMQIYWGLFSWSESYAEIKPKIFRLSTHYGFLAKIATSFFTSS